jgi:hypothetical protein
LEVIAMSSPAAPRESGSIELPAPQYERAAPLLGLLRARRSSREFSPRALPLDVLSTLLWAAFGINRPETAGRISKK